MDCERSEPFLKQIIFFKLLLRLVQISDADTPTCQPQRTAEREAEDKAGLKAEAAEAEAEALAEAETVALAAAKEKATLEAEAREAEGRRDGEEIPTCRALPGSELDLKGGINENVTESH